MWKHSFASSVALRGGWALGLVVALAAWSVASAEPALRIAAIEWIPLNAHGVILKKLEAALKEGSGGAEVSVRRFSALGSEEDLSQALKELSSERPDVLIGFGDHVSLAARKQSPILPLIVVLARDTKAFATKSETEPPLLTLLETDPSAEQVWEVARELKADARGVGIVSTKTFAPNAALSAALEGELGKSGAKVTRIPIDPGYCRTESDFERAIRGAHEAGAFDVLFVPDDPNCSRFGPVIMRVAGSLGVPVIGTEAIAGKGCGAALVPDYEGIAREIAGLCLGVKKGEPLPSGPKRIPRLVVLGDAAEGTEGTEERSTDGTDWHR